MWRDPRKTDSPQISCSKCNGLCEVLHSDILSTSICKTCNKPPILFKCIQSNCGYYMKICPNCCNKLRSNKSKTTKDSSECSENSWTYSYFLSTLTDPYFLSVFFIMALSYVLFLYKSGRSDPASLVENLRENYPSQKNESWFHILGVLEQEIPAVKSITFLHGKDKKTSDCLTKDLIYIFTKSKNIKDEEFTFSDFKADDYGFLLEHYHAIVKKFRVLVTNLNEVPGNVAPIFHSLCDEVSSDIKPSLFIFKLKYDDKSKTLKPLERATSLLRKAWNELPENELSPLLSRVVKNVVDIVPEYKIKC